MSSHFMWNNIFNLIMSLIAHDWRMHGCAFGYDNKYIACNDKYSIELDYHFSLDLCRTEDHFSFVSSIWLTQLFMYVCFFCLIHQCVCGSVFGSVCTLFIFHIVGVSRQLAVQFEDQLFILLLTSFIKTFGTRLNINITLDILPV